MPQILDSRVYKVYFDLPDGYNPYVIPPEGSESPLSSCICIATNAEDAMQKLRDAFPGREVTGLHCDGTAGPMQLRDKVVI